ncbi:MAG: DNA polymerase III subunit epsilon [Flavobacteriales bacterium]|nr:DNA polymerase III subunit epsilon [Flavobacteriales bacterium]
MYSIIDIEATGGNSKIGRITEIAIYKFDGIQIVDEFHSLVNPEMKIPPFVQKLTGIDNKMAAEAPLFRDIAHEVDQITRNSCFVAHNVKFDYSFFQMEYASIGQDYKRERLCTLQLSESLIPEAPAYGLGKLCKSLEIPLNGRHSAKGDAQATVELFKQLLERDQQSSFSKIEKYRRRP